MFHERPNTIIYQYPLPSKAALLVYAGEDLHKKYNPQNGAVAILVDYSGSMNFSVDPGIDKKGKPIRPDGKANNKLEEAENLKKFKKEKTRRIDRALQGLNTMLLGLPKNMEVSLWIFKGPTRAAGLDIDIQELKRTNQWDPEEDPRRFMNALKDLEPRGGTPMVQAMRKAAKTLLRSKRRRSHGHPD